MQKLSIEEVALTFRVPKGWHSDLVYRLIREIKAYQQGRVMYFDPENGDLMRTSLEVSELDAREQAYWQTQQAQDLTPQEVIKLADMRFASGEKHARVWLRETGVLPISGRYVLVDSAGKCHWLPDAEALYNLFLHRVEKHWDALGMPET